MILSITNSKVVAGTKIYTDEYPVYWKLLGFYEHKIVQHRANEYVHK